MIQKQAPLLSNSKHYLHASSTSEKKISIVYAKQPIENYKRPTPHGQFSWLNQITNYLF